MELSHSSRPVIVVLRDGAMTGTTLAPWWRIRGGHGNKVRQCMSFAGAALLLLLSAAVVSGFIPPTSFVKCGDTKLDLARRPEVGTKRTVLSWS